MILRWDDLVLCYGPELSQYAKRFEEAGRQTHALLCCRFTPSNARIGASRGEHAEQRLLASTLWTTEIANALATWTPGGSPFLVSLVINRSPCRDCTKALTRALRELQWKFAARFPHSRFLLASRGAYQGKVGDAGYYENATTVGDLAELRHAGWELCVLQTGRELSPSGAELLQALQHLQATPDATGRLRDPFGQLQTH